MTLVRVIPALICWPIFETNIAKLDMGLIKRDRSITQSTDDHEYGRDAQ